MFNNKHRLLQFDLLTRQFIIDGHEKQKNYYDFAHLAGFLVENCSYVHQTRSS